MASAASTISRKEADVLWHTLTQTGQKIMSPFSSGSRALDKCVGGLIRWARLMDMTQDASELEVAVTAAMERACLRLGSCMLTSIFGFAPEPWALAEVCLRKIRGAALVTVAPVILRGISGAPSLRPGAATRPEAVKAAAMCFEHLEFIPDELRMAFALAADIATEGDATADWTGMSLEALGEPLSAKRLIVICRAVAKESGLSAAVYAPSGRSRLLRQAAQSAIALGNPYVIDWLYNACVDDIQPADLREKVIKALTGSGIAALTDRIDGLCLMCAFSESADRFSNLFERSLADCRLELPKSAYDSGWADAMTPLKPLRGAALPSDVVEFARVGFMLTAPSAESRGIAAAAAAAAASSPTKRGGDDDDDGGDGGDAAAVISSPGEDSTTVIAHKKAVIEEELDAQAGQDIPPVGLAHDLSTSTGSSLLDALSGAGADVTGSGSAVASMGLGGLPPPAPAPAQAPARESAVDLVTMPVTSPQSSVVGGLLLPGMSVTLDQPVLAVPGLSVSPGMTAATSSSAEISNGSASLTAVGAPVLSTPLSHIGGLGLGLPGLSPPGQPLIPASLPGDGKLSLGLGGLGAGLSAGPLSTFTPSLPSSAPPAHSQWHMPRPRVLDEETRHRLRGLVQAKAREGGATRSAGLSDPQPLVVVCGGPLARQSVAELMPRFAAALLNGEGGVLIFGMTPGGDVVQGAEEMLTSPTAGLSNCRGLVEELLHSQLCPVPPISRWDAFWESMAPADEAGGHPSAAVLGLRFLPAAASEVLEANTMYFGAGVVHRLGEGPVGPCALPVTDPKDLAEMIRSRLRTVLHSRETAPVMEPTTFKLGLV